MKSFAARAAVCFCILAAVSLAAPLRAQTSPDVSAPPAIPASRDLDGVWENGDRFVEFSEAGMRIVLKPYYGFVWEDTGVLPATVAGENGLFTITAGYPGEKNEASIPVAVAGDGLYLAFMRRVESTASGAASSGPVSPLDGFWLAGGNSDGIRLYRQALKEEIFAYYFAGSSYCRIRYWAVEALKKDIQAEFILSDGSQGVVPKFLEIGEVLYTCITSTGRVLRNYERGSFTVDGGALLFKPENVVYEGTAALVYEPVPFVLSEDGSTLALGKPYLVRSTITNLDTEIAVHNGKRRPPRKPVFGYMELDFRWDEIDRIRGNEAPEPFNSESWVIEKPEQ
ncbi:MAG: hypothetical protein EWM51_01850 [Treponema sp.]|nr:MAG: hypothetical protein EWM51_01850 [Treponema sp.]